MADIEQVVTKYRELRDKKKELKEGHVKELRPFNDALEKMEAWLGGELLKQKAESVRTKHGTVYKTITTAVKVVDREAVLAYLNESGDNLSSLDLRINTTAAEDHLQENQAPIPGTEVTRRVNIRIKK
tara:strand:- start:748 stop:1131 length:384 start_codon:yes stop_codon:yes gene_type:complete